MFPARDRRQLKNKFKKEEKDNKKLIDLALNSTLPLGYIYNTMVCEN